MTLYGAHDEVADLRLDRSRAHLVQVYGAKVTRLYNNAVSEIDDTALSVCKTTVV